MAMRRFLLGVLLLVQLAVIGFVVWLLFGTVAAMVILLITLAGFGRLNIMHGRLPIGGGFGCDHEWEHKGGINVPQCARCGIWRD